MHVDTPLLEKRFAEILQVLRSSGEDPSVRTDFGQLALQYTWNVSCDAMFGTSAAEDAADREAFTADFAAIANMARWLTIFNNQMPWLADVAFWRTFRPTRRRLFRYVEDHAVMVLQSSEGRKNKKPETLIEGLAARTSDVQRIRSETLNLLLGGSDGAKTGLCELFYLLARHPAVWEKLKAEVASLGGRHPSPAELRSLTYTNWCINEGESEAVEAS
jgi:cytochrome P450